MPEVFADTSPLQYLHQIGLLSVLPFLYERLVVASAVLGEIETGLDLGVSLPDLRALPWIGIRSATHRQALRFSPDLGPGEKETLALALESREPLVILDDALGRRHAALLEIPCTGTLGVLLKAKQRGALTRLAPCLDRLAELGFRLSPATRSSALRLAGE